MLFVFPILHNHLKAQWLLYVLPALTLKNCACSMHSMPCVSYDSRNKECVFPCTAVTNWSLLRRWAVFCLTWSLNFYKYLDELKAAGD